jgi:uncharacterized phage protein (TIGR01671 family)
MLFVGDAFGTTHPLDCAVYAKNGQDLILLQFTGLKDKNGKEIYEGDIVQYSMPDMAGEDVWYTEEVTFVDGCFTLDGSAPVSLINDAMGQVIGNIFENPDLLTK